MYLRFLPRADEQWEGRDHFFQAAARTMRAILVDHARRKHAKKRGANPRRIVLDEVLQAYQERSLDILAALVHKLGSPLGAVVNHVHLLAEEEDSRVAPGVEAIGQAAERSEEEPAK